MAFIYNPNLPESEIKLAAVSADAKSMIEALSSEGIGVIKVERNEALFESISSHADLQLIHLTGKDVMFAGKCGNKTADMLSAIGFTVRYTEKELSNKYPGDCLLNAVIINNSIVCNTKAIDKSLCQYAEQRSWNIINVSQGYTKCSTAVVADKVIITADKKIADAMINENIDVLLIKPGYIELEGFDTGFIGGCCGKVSSDILLFNGNLSEHPDYNNITSFARNYGVYIETAGKGALKDFGGIIPLMQ